MFAAYYYCGEGEEADGVSVAQCAARLSADAPMTSSPA